MWVYARQRVPTWPAPTRNPGCWFSSEFPWQTTVNMCCHRKLRKELRVYSGALQESGKLVHGFPETSQVAFPSADFALCPLAVINCTCEGNNIWTRWVLLNYPTWGKSGDPWAGVLCQRKKEASRRRPRFLASSLSFYTSLHSTANL